MATIKKACKGGIYPKSSSVSGRIGAPSKAKSGGSFPDLNKDGKITKKDVLIGRGVLPKTAKKGMKIRKAQNGIDSTSIYENRLFKSMDNAVATKGTSKNKQANKEVNKSISDLKRYNSKKTTPKQKMGGKTKKCKYGCY